MNKRQAKKKFKKEMFLDYAKTYREDRAIDRLCHEHNVVVERKRKACKNCPQYKPIDDWFIHSPCCCCANL